MKDQKRILFIYLSPSSFVNADREILKENYEVTEFQFFSSPQNNLRIPFIWLVQFFWLVKHIRSADLVYGWFADYHLMIPAFFSRLYKKPMAIVMGGTDAMNIPMWKHGVFSSKWRSPIARYVYRSAAQLLPVSSTLISSKNVFTYHPKEEEFGIKKELKELPGARINPLPTGYDESFWRIESSEREAVVTTVAFINSSKRVWIKGIDHLLSVAELLPHFEFRIVGIKEELEPVLRSKYTISENVKLLPPAPLDELISIYNQTSIYLQLSRIEGLPNVLCEAMLCGCIPIGSNVFGIPEVISETDQIIQDPDPKQIAMKIEEQHKTASSDIREATRAKMVENFSIGKREKELKDILNELMV